MNFMENKNIILLQHSPLSVHFTNTFYTNQADNLSDYIVVDVTSRVERNKAFMKEHPTFAKDLSPFYIGPVISSDGVEAKIFEIFWQCGKVYPCHDDHGKPNKDFFVWRNALYAKDVCSRSLMRHACKDLGYEHKDTKYFAYYDKDKKDYVPLDYIESRKKVYFVEYAKLVYNTPSFKYLKDLVDKGHKIALVDFDGYNYYYEQALERKYNSYLNKCKENKTTPTLTLADFKAIKSMKDVINCSFLLMGHGFVIKALLQGDIEVIDGEVVDKAGILK